MKKQKSKKLYLCGPDVMWEINDRFHRTMRDAKKYCDDPNKHGIAEVEISFKKWIRKPVKK